MVVCNKRIPLIRFHDRLPSRVPESAKKVFSGVIFDVYQWQQDMHDGSKATFEMLRRPDTVDVIALTTDGKIIVIHEEKWSKPTFTTIPGGRVEVDEDLEAAARRELLEETGYKPSTIEPWFAEQPFSKIDWNVYIYIARGCKKVANRRLDIGEKIQCTLTNLDQFIDLLSGVADVPPSLIKMALQARLNPQKMAALKRKILGRP